MEKLATRAMMGKPGQAHNEVRLPTLRRVIGAGAPVAPSVLGRFCSLR